MIAHVRKRTVDLLSALASSAAADGPRSIRGGIAGIDPISL
jgi:hypothetical protein